MININGTKVTKVLVNGQNVDTVTVNGVIVFPDPVDFFGDGSREGLFRFDGTLNEAENRIHKTGGSGERYEVINGKKYVYGEDVFDRYFLEFDASGLAISQPNGEYAFTIETIKDWTGDTFGVRDTTNVNFPARRTFAKHSNGAEFREARNTNTSPTMFDFDNTAYDPGVPIFYGVSYDPATRKLTLFTKKKGSNTLVTVKTLAQDQVLQIQAPRAGMTGLTRVRMLSLFNRKITQTEFEKLADEAFNP